MGMQLKVGNNNIVANKVLSNNSVARVSRVFKHSTLPGASYLNSLDTESRSDADNTHRR